MILFASLYVYLFCGALALLWFNAIAKRHQYARRWHEVADYSIAFALGPVSLLVFAGWEAWKRWQGWKAAR